MRRERLDALQLRFYGRCHYLKATLLKRFDALAGPLLAWLFGKPGRGDLPASPRSALFIRPGGIGDAVLLVPALRAFMAACPDCRIDILAEKRNAQAFLLCPGIGAVHLYDSPAGLAAALTGGYDLVVDTEQWYRLSAVVARLVRAPRSIGFDGNDRVRLFTDPVVYSQQDYEAISFFGLLAPLGIEPPMEITAPFLHLPAAAAYAAKRLLAPLQGRRFVALFPGASVPKKQWGGENFRTVALALDSEGIAVVIVGGEDAFAAGEAIAEGGVALNLAGKGTLVESAALIAGAQLLVSGDSGLLHIAAGVGTPTVSIFGPSDPVKWGPKGEGHLAFRSSLHCAPCSRFGSVPACPVAVRCMDAEAPRVADAVLRILKGVG